MSTTKTMTVDDGMRTLRLTITISKDKDDTLEVCVLHPPQAAAITLKPKDVKRMLKFLEPIPAKPQE